jgi:uncharacterized membrane protein YbhN (UPF0104 family)
MPLRSPDYRRRVVPGRVSWQLFVEGGQPRVRRASDAVSALCAALLLVGAGLVAVPPFSFEQSVVDVFEAVPGWFDFLWRIAVLGLVAWPVVLIVAAAVRGRWDTARDLFLGVLAAVGIGLVANRVITGSWSTGMVLLGADPAQSYPVLALGVAGAVVAVVRPDLTQPVRRFGRWVVGVGVLGLLMLSVTTPVGAVCGLLLGQLAAALVHLAFGTEDGVPTPSSAMATVAALGVEVVSLTPATRQDAGVYALSGPEAGGRQVTVRIYGRDARDTQLIATLWRSLWYRSASTASIGRTERAEHEAFVTLRLRELGVPAPELVAAGGIEGGDAAVVVRRRGRSLREFDAGRVGPPEIEQCWGLLASAHEAGLALGDVGRGTFLVSDHTAASDGTAPAGSGTGPVIFDQLPTATSAPAEADLCTDRAQLLVLSCLLVDSERATGIAVEQLGPDSLAEVLPFVQSAALERDLRKEVKAAGLDLEQLRRSASEAAGVDPPDMAAMRRVSWGSVAKLAAFAAIGYFLITQLAQVDFEEVWAEFQQADWAWILVAGVIAQVAIASLAITTQGASPRRIPYGPLVVLQFAIAFVMLAVPSTAARIAVIVRFFQKQGVGASAAVSVSLLDSFAGFLVQVAVLLLVLGAGVGGVQFDLQLDLEGGGSDLVTALVLLAVVAVVVGVVAVALPRTRRWIVERVRAPVLEMWDTARGVRSPRRLVEVFGGNFMTQVIYALCLGACVRAFGVPTGGIAAMMVVYIAAALFGGFMPVPGGVGVMEAALVAGLEAVGVADAAAVGAAICFRALTFYLPPIWGVGATAWLRRRGDL